MKKVLFKLFPNFFIVKKVYGECREGEYNIAIIEPDSSKVTEALGITPERFKELSEIGVKAYKESDKFTDALKKGYAQVKHPNELYFMTVILEEQHSRNINPLYKLLNL